MDAPFEKPAALSGLRIENPADRESVTFLVTSEQTGGEYIRYEVRFRPGGAGAHHHMHPVQLQTIEVLQGRMGFILNGVERIYGAGETVHVEPGSPHLQWNAGEEELVCVQEQRPAGEMEEFLLNAFGLVRDGRMTTLQSAAVLAEFSACTRQVGWRRAVFIVLGLAARVLGYKGRYPEYSITSAALSRQPTSDPVPAA